MSYDPNYVRPNPRTKYAGVYAILHIPSGRMYLGGSSDMTSRFTRHRFFLRRRKHKCVGLQRLWDITEESEFEFKILERCRPQDVRVAEQRWHDRTPNSLNTIKGCFFVGARGPSLASSTAAKKRWAKPTYRRKRAKFLENRTLEGRFMRQEDGSAL